ncbi:hypothetical protein [Dactylosporangium matsuzakiense]|uniref:hypothetical protein n=1 Tax=Dactylosporangium matsuzakiense TaxID=53360 RepID=UPI0021C32A10|nr:hypothetical protein [Dactylosporangium matsuzakiense]UWZ41236.1 hypothetical protein Dmats_26540 [Dactylosporangium matsuzakiense]
MSETTGTAPAGAPSTSGASGCCGNPPAATHARAEPAAAAPCCGTAAEAATDGSCCGRAARADAVAAGQGCCG